MEQMGVRLPNSHQSQPEQSLPGKNEIRDVKWTERHQNGCRRVKPNLQHTAAQAQNTRRNHSTPIACSITTKVQHCYPVRHLQQLRCCERRPAAGAHADARGDENSDCSTSSEKPGGCDLGEQRGACFRRQAPLQ